MTRTTIFTVQTIARRAERLVAGGADDYRSAEEALAVALRHSASSVGVLVVEFEGEAACENWGKPRVVARYGDVPLSLVGG